MNSYNSNDFPQSSLGFVCFALTAIFLFIASSEMTGQQFQGQPSFNELGFRSQPYFNLAPFKEEIRILPFKGTASFKENLTSDLINEIKLFPNPTADYLNIDTSNDAQIMIYSISGALLESNEINEGMNTLDVSELDSGIYFVVISSLTDSQTSRFIIEK